MVATADAVKPRCGDRKEEVDDMEACVQKKTALDRAVSILPFAGAQTRRHGSSGQKILQI
jgi:hypothetical protein